MYATISGPSLIFEALIIFTMVCSVLANSEPYSGFMQVVTESNANYKTNEVNAKKEIKSCGLKRDERSLKYNFKQRRKNAINKLFGTTRITTCTPFFIRRPASKEKLLKKFTFGKLALDGNNYTDSGLMTMHNITAHPKRRKFMNLFFHTKTLNNYSQLLKEENGFKNGITTLNGESYKYISEEMLSSTFPLNLHLKNNTIQTYTTKKSKIKKIFNNFANSSLTKSMLSTTPIADQNISNNLVDQSKTIPSSVKTTKRTKLKKFKTKSMLITGTTNVIETNIINNYDYKKQYQNFTTISETCETDKGHTSVDSGSSKLNQAKYKIFMKNILNFNKRRNRINEYNNSKTINYKNNIDMTTEYYLTVFPNPTVHLKHSKNTLNLEDENQIHLGKTTDGSHSFSEYSSESMHLQNHIHDSKPTQKKKNKLKSNSRKYIKNMFCEKQLTNGTKTNISLHQTEENLSASVVLGGFETQNVYMTPVTLMTCVDSDFIPVTGLQNNMFRTTKNNEMYNFTYANHGKNTSLCLHRNSTIENRSTNVHLKNHQTSENPRKALWFIKLKNIFHKETKIENDTKNSILTMSPNEPTTNAIQTQILSSTELDKTKKDSIDNKEETESVLERPLDHKTAMQFKDIFKKQSLCPNEFNYSSTTELNNHVEVEKSVTRTIKLSEKKKMVNHGKPSANEVQEECKSYKSDNSDEVNNKTEIHSKTHEKIITDKPGNSTFSDRIPKKGNKTFCKYNKPFRKLKFEKVRDEAKQNVMLSKCKPNYLMVVNDGNLFKWCVNTSSIKLSSTNISTISISTSEVTINNKNSVSTCSNCSVTRFGFKHVFKFLKHTKLTNDSENSVTNPLTPPTTSKETTTIRSKYLVYNKPKNGSISANNLTFANSDQINSYPKAKTRIYPPMKINKHYNTKKIYSPFERIATPKINENVTESETDHFHSFVENIAHKKNSTVLLHPDYLNYMDSKVKNKKFKNLLFKSKQTNNTNSSNDTSFHILAYVKKPFESLISVFRATFSNVTKVGEVNTTNVNNISLPNHLDAPNSSIIILDMNNTRNLTKEMHESKIGLFDMLGGWFHCVLESFSEPRPQDIHFYLYTRNNLNDPEEIIILDTKLSYENDTDYPEPVLEKEMPSEFSARAKREPENNDYFESLSFAKSNLQSKWFNILSGTKILIHGYIQDYQTDIMVNMKDAYLKKEAFNVILVDWSVIGDNSCYPMVATKALRSVGGLVAQLVDQLGDGGVSPATIHIVGFSLGAHVAGHAGTELTHGLVYRITGLDPALPYIPMEPDISLDSGDAMFVDIIHSAAGYLGQPGPMGHVDFYPNGGSQQPGCDLTTLGACSHRRSALYFIESINTEDGFLAVKCDSWHDFQAGRCNHSSPLPMGDACPNNASGKYYLVTGQKEPFAQLSEEHNKVKKSLWQDLLYDLD